MYSGSCERQEDKNKYHLIIQNNSDKILYVEGSICFSVALDSTCKKPTTRMEYNQLIHYLTQPFTSQKMGADVIVDEMMIHPETIWSIGVFHWEDIETMSCEEFTRVFPLKKLWELTLDDLESCNWTLVYSPEEDGGDS